MMADEVEDKVDGIVLDLGVSSMQLDEEDRGFSFSSQARLDMRMDGSSGISAFEVVNSFEEAELSKIIRNYGEEKNHRRIAKKIVENREKKEITTCLELAEIVKKVYGFQAGKIHPATKTFQAIRIFVNDELGELEKALEAAQKLLKPGGRLVVVSFHSLEDSLVKAFVRQESGYNDRNFSRYEPLSVLVDQVKVHSFSLPKGSVIKPSEEELRENVRSRSARLRLAIKN
jgi:16S rRNA (cytosine1402-N4)-methyltransferase